MGHSVFHQSSLFHWGADGCLLSSSTYSGSHLNSSASSEISPIQPARSLESRRPKSLAGASGAAV